MSGTSQRDITTTLATLLRTIDDCEGIEALRDSVVVVRAREVLERVARADDDGSHAFKRFRQRAIHSHKSIPL